MRRFFYLLFLVSLVAIYSMAQSPNSGNTPAVSPYNFQGNDTVYVSDTLKFYDNGGQNNDYTASVKGAVTFVPQSGQAIKLIFREFNTNADFVVYEGYSTDAADIIVSHTGNKNNLPDIISSSDDGAITVEFKPIRGKKRGWYIDVVSFTPSPAVITNVSSVSLSTETVLKGSENQQMVRVDVTVTGDRCNINLLEIVFSAENSTSMGDISQATLYYTDTISIFNTLTPYATANIEPDGTVTFNGNTVIKKAGIYKFWLTYNVASTATANNVLKGKFVSINDGTSSHTPSQIIETERTIRSGFSGNYIIGTSSFAHYPTFAAAITAMKNTGIDGAVVFTVENGVYTQRVTVPHIEGASFVNTITFKSQNSNYNDVTIQTNNSNPIFTINGADYITIDGIGFKTTSSAPRDIIQITNVSRHVTIKNCLVEAPKSMAIANSIVLIKTKAANEMYKNNDYLTVQNCYLAGGRTGIECNGTSYVKLPKQQGGKILGNTITGQGYMGIYMTKEHGGIIDNNTISVSGAVNNGFKAIDATMTGNIIIRNNKIHIDNTTDKYAHAIYLRARDNNESLAGRNRIYNNQIIYDNAVDDVKAIMCPDELANVDIVYNSINIMHNNPTMFSTAIQMNSGIIYTLKSVLVANNIFQNNANGFIYSFTRGIDLNQIRFHNNVCYSSNPATFAKHNSDTITFADWQSAGRDQQSVWAQVQFLSESNLNVKNASNLNIAQPLNYVTSDINNTLRSTTNPTAGAYEFVTQSLPPTFTENYPEIINITYNSAKAKVKLTENGKLYFIVKAVSLPAPEINEILSNDSTDMYKNIENQINLEGLNFLTAYKVYFIIKGNGNYQSPVITSSEFTTSFHPTEVSTFEGVTATSGDFTDATADFSGFVVENITDGVGTVNQKAAKMTSDSATITINNHLEGLILNGFNFKSDAVITLKAKKVNDEVGTISLQPTNGKWVFISLKSLREITSVLLTGTGNVFIDNFSGEPQTLTATLNDTVINENTDLTLHGEINGGVLPYTYVWTNPHNDTLSTSETMTITAINTTAIKLAIVDGWNNRVAVKNKVTVIGSSKTATFDDLYLEPEGYWRGDAENYTSTFYSGSYGFSNMFVPSLNSWGGFGYSNFTSTSFVPSNYMTDQFKSAVGHGINNSSNYAVIYTLGAPINVTVENNLQGDSISGCYITNNAWVIYVSENGTGINSTGNNDANTPFATGDWYKITATGDNGKYVEFYLADYRSGNMANHYTVDSWQWFDLSPLGKVKKVSFRAEGTRVNAIGSTIPFYFCMDDFGGERKIDILDNVNLNTGDNVNLNLNIIANNNIVAGADIEYAVIDSADNTLVIASLNGNMLNIAGLQQGNTDILIRQTSKGKSVFIKIHIEISQTTNDFEYTADNVLVISPNPATFEFRLNTGGDLGIFTLSGQKIYSQTQYKANTPINISALAKGTYIIVINGHSIKLSVK